MVVAWATQGPKCGTRIPPKTLLMGKEKVTSIKGTLFFNTTTLSPFQVHHMAQTIGFSQVTISHMTTNSTAMKCRTWREHSCECNFKGF